MKGKIEHSFPIKVLVPTGMSCIDNFITVGTVNSRGQNFVLNEEGVKGIK